MYMCVSLLLIYSYFGERALLLSEPRSANVIAETKVRCLLISQKAFEQVCVCAFTHNVPYDIHTDSSHCRRLRKSCLVRNMYTQYYQIMYTERLRY
jgi:CRP-like cAMP-binding protein